MVLCHVSWVPLAFTWKSGWTFWTSECCFVLENTSECCCILDDLHLGSSRYSSGFIMYEWRHEFLGLSYAFHMIFWTLSISSGFSTYIKVLPDNTLPELPWKLCRREESGFWFLHAHDLRDCVVHVQYQLSYVSNSDWVRQAFLFAFHLLYCS